VANPPPIPPPAAGYWWRTFACLADIIPLMFLGWALAALLASPEELAARKQTEAWTQRLTNQYMHALQTGNQRELQGIVDAALHPKKEDLDAAEIWITFQGTMTFMTMLGALTMQEWLMKGRTIGKLIFSLRTIQLPMAEPPSFLSALLRSAWKAAFFALPNPLFMILGIINFHVPLFRRDKRAWHDLWSRSQVVDARLP
jgi:hypothetical protein